MNKLLLVGPNSIHLWRYADMIKDDFKEIMVLTKDCKDNDLMSKLNVHNINFGLKNPFLFCTSIKNIRKFVEEFKPDIIHIHEANIYALATLLAIKKFTIPVVLTAWGSEVLLLPNESNLYKRMVKYSLSNSTVLTSDSLYMSSIMRNLVPEKQLSIVNVNYGIGILPQDTIKENLIYSNRLHDDLYRIDKIIIQFEKFIKKQNQDWNLVIAGIGPKTNDLLELTKTLGIESNVKFVGWLNAKENAEFYNRAKIYVSIPYDDATSISLLEAMACGCIPVVSNLPANLEWIIDGINGIVADDLNAAFFEDALKIDYNTVATLNKKIIEQKATIKVNKEKFINIYTNLLK